MNIRVEVYYASSEHSVLCFNHAVEQANLGIEIRTEVTDELWSTCKRCLEEWERKERLEEEMFKKNDVITNTKPLPKIKRHPKRMRGRK